MAITNVTITMTVAMTTVAAVMEMLLMRRLSIS